MKRARLSSLANIPYNTNDGGAWLKKALDPAELNVDVIGMPDANTNPRTVLNYQMQADVPIPDAGTYVPTSVASYDATLYLYQNPIIFGMSSCFPSGSRDPISSPMYVNFKDGTVSFNGDCAPRTVTYYLNDQIEGSSYHEKLSNLKKYCQRYRMIYGGTQCIPACSDMFDSGTIEATQQIYNPENTFSGDAVYLPKSEEPDGINKPEDIKDLVSWYTYCQTIKNPKRRQVFNENDFPDTNNAIQNPSSLFCRYKEGCYMPLKIKNPANHVYLNSEDRCVNSAPLIMSSEAFWYIKKAATNDVFNYQNYTTAIINMTYDAATASFKPTSNPLSEGYSLMTSTIYIKCFSKTGIPIWLVFSDEQKRGTAPQTNYVDEGSTLTFNMPQGPQDIYQKAEPFYSYEKTLPSYENLDVKRVQYVSFVNTTMPVNSLQPKIAFEPFTVLPSPESNIGIINFKSVAIQASIRLIFRMGFEFAITAGGVYSPFKRKAPRFDQKAINAYISAIHNMRDAFYGDAATSGGHGEYSERIMDLVTGNQGGTWYGRVAV